MMAFLDKSSMCGWENIGALDSPDQAAGPWLPMLLQMMGIAAVMVQFISNH